MLRTLGIFLILVSICTFIAISGCPSSQGRVGSKSIVAPVFRGYEFNPAILTVGDPAKPNLPDIDGKVDSFTIAPHLPEGLAIHFKTGTISGTPLHALDETLFIVTAHRGLQGYTTKLFLSILAPHVVITADHPLVTSVAEAGGGSVVSGASLSPESKGHVPDAACASVNTSGVAVKYEAPSSPLAPPDVTSNPGIVWDATTPFMAMISVSTVGLPVSVPLAPELLPPYSSVAATLPSFEMVSTGGPAALCEATLALGLTQLGGAGLTFLSNALPTHRVRIRQLSAGQDLTTADGWTEFRDSLYYKAVNSQGKDALFVHNEASTTFRQLFDVANGGGDEPPMPLAEYNSRLFLRARKTSGPKRLDLFRYDDLTDTLTCTSETYAHGDDIPESPAVYAGSLFFTARISPNKRKLFRYTEDGLGTFLTLARLVDTAGIAGNDDPMSPMVHAGGLYFSARLANGARKLFRFDSANPNSVQQISDTAGGPAADDEPTLLTEVQGKLYFSARNTFNARKVWRYDVNTHWIEEITNLRADPTADDAPASFVEWNGKLYFAGSPAASLTKLYRYDPASGALAQVSETAGVGLDDAPSAVVGLAGSVYFAARNSAGTRKLWRFDESTQSLTQVSNTRLDPAWSDDPQGLTAFAGKLYFTALRAGGIRKLYQFDPLENTVCQVADTRVNPNADDKTTIVGVHGAHLMFSSVPAAGGAPQLFRLCDESTGCID